jgi:hypothetical protein
MRTAVVVILVAGVVGLGGSVAVALAHTSSAMVPMPGSFEEARDTGETKFKAKLAELEIEVEPIEATPVISRDAAIDVATKFQDEHIAHEARAITAMYGRFSNPSTSPDDALVILPGTNRVMNNVPVWIVTFHGVCMLHSGPCMIDGSGKQIPSTRDPYVFGDANVILDAETGEVLQGFSYNTSS